MKKILVLFTIIAISIPQVFAINFGMYKPEEDYGLFDGFKVNFGRKSRDEGRKLIELKSEDPVERAKIEREKARYNADKDQKADDEYQMFKFMLDDTIPF